METVDYKHKYKEALERAKKWRNAPNVDKMPTYANRVIEEIFPELAESEDEKIRKQIISFLKEFEYDHYRSLDFSSWIDWLEKQGEQKPTDKVEPKFKNGQWIVWQNKCYKVNYNGCGYELIDQNGLSTSLEYVTVDENAHLWTIQDAEDGDVLYSPEYNLLWIYKNKEQCHASINLNYAKSVSFGFDIVIPSDVQPATKEQRVLLYHKIYETGYEWDADKKELKKGGEE